MCRERCRLSPLSSLICFTYISTILYIYRGALSAVIYQIKSSSGAGLGINSVEAGALGSSFIGGFIVFGPVFGYFSQRVHPEYLMSIGLSIWCCAVFLTAVSRTFPLLLLARSITGVGEASFLALAPAYIMERAPAQKKNVWIGIYYSAQVIGFALGQNYGSGISNFFGDWYYPFYFEPFFMIPMILVVLFNYKDPKLIFKKEGGEREPFATQFKIILGNPVFMLVTLGVSAFQFVLSGYAFWVMPT